MNTKKIWFGVALTLVTVAASVTVIYKAAVKVAAEEAAEKAAKATPGAATQSSPTQSSSLR